MESRTREGFDTRLVLKAGPGLSFCLLSLDLAHSATRIHHEGDT